MTFGYFYGLWDRNFIIQNDRCNMESLNFEKFMKFMNF